MITSSYILILFWFLLMALFAHNVQVTEKKRIMGKERTIVKWWYAILVFAPLVIMAMNRSAAIGDTLVYIAGYRDMPSSFSGLPAYYNSLSKDKAYFMLAALIKCVFGSNYRIYFCIVAIIHAYAVIKIYRQYSPSFVMAVFLFVTSGDYISWMENGTRQFLAVAICLLATDFMLKKKYNTSFILYGVAITFKLQAIFLLPAIGIIYLKNRDFSFKQFLWVPLVNFVLYIPAVIIGKPITSIFDAYLCQTKKYAYKTTLGYPNIYYFAEIDRVDLIKPGIILTMILLFALMIFVLYTKGKLNDKGIIELSVTVLFLVTFFLPEMHDRYGYVAEVLSLVYFFMIEKDWLILLIINLNAFANYASFLDGIPEEILPIISIYQLVVVLYFTLNFIRHRLRQDYLTE